MVSRRTLVEISAFAVLLAAAGAGTASGWLRDTTWRPDTSVKTITPLAEFAINERFANAGFPLAKRPQINAVKVDENGTVWAYATVLLKNGVSYGMPAAFQLKARLDYGWHAGSIVPFNNG